MSILGGIIGGIGKAAEGIGNAVNKNVKTIKGDKAEAEVHTHEEQMAVLNQYSAEFASRAPKTKWDSFVDGLNRLPRPLLTFGIFFLFCWAYINPGAFIDYMAAVEIIPDTLWQLFMLVVAFFFGGRFVKEDLARPKLTEEQRNKAIALIKERERAAQEAEDKSRPPDVIIAVPPTSKPPASPDSLPDVPVDTASLEAVNAMIESLIAREGGYVNHPADKGGPTRWGVTLQTLADWREAPCTAEDVKNLSKEEAIKIYRALYYIGPGIDTLPQGIQSHILDIGVNSGPRTAIKMLQRVLNSFGESLVIDGVIGNATRDACRRYEASKINNSLVEARMRFYEDIVANNPSQRVFMAGWTKRAESFLA